MISDYMYGPLARILLWVLYIPLTLYQGTMEFSSTFPLPHDHFSSQLFQGLGHTRSFDVHSSFSCPGCSDDHN
jgi:hypothetical protein